MTRGRKPLTALREAERIAQKRGEVRHFAHEREMICPFVIFTTVSVAFVRIRRVRRLRCTPAQLEGEASEDLAILRSIAYAAGISRELWICSPKGSFRFFRVLDTSLMEFTRDGRIVAAPVAAPLPCPVPEPGMGMPVPGSCPCPIEELPCDSSVEVPRPSPPSSLMTCRDSPAPGQNDLSHIGEIPAPEHGAGVETDPIK